MLSMIKSIVNKILIYEVYTRYMEGRSLFASVKRGRILTQRHDKLFGLCIRNQINDSSMSTVVLSRYFYI